MQLAIFIYLLTIMLLWQITGNFALTMQRPEDVSSAERNLWCKNNVVTLIGIILAKGLWFFALAYPIYWGITQSILQAIILFIVGNIGVIIFAALIKRWFSIPEIILVYLGIVLCPFLIVGIWFIRV
jgi:hypothetical protein